VRLGASVNAIPMNFAYENKMSLKDWIDKELDTLDTRIKKCSDPVEKASVTVASIMIPSECSGWQKFYKEYQESLKISQVWETSKEVKERGNFDMLEMLEDLKAYFVDVKQVIEDHGAKTLKGKFSADETPNDSGWNDSNGWGWGDPSALPEKQPRSYIFLSTGYVSHGNVAQHFRSYDELYEACYVGDNEKIQSLCLPAEGAQPDSILLNISVKMIDNTEDDFKFQGNLYGNQLPEAPEYIYIFNTYFKGYGYTPLFAAVAARRWSTAKLILAIAAAQYHPEDEDDKISFYVDRGK
jgi:hypothetical protein